MKKRLISVLILVTMLFTMIPVNALNTIAYSSDSAGNVAQDTLVPDNPFRDVRDDSWYYDAVEYSRINGFFSGINADTFDPDGTMTRGMFVTVLARMAGVNPTAYAGQSAFSDVAQNAYYAPYVVWAAKYGITAGVGNGKFDPDGLIDREQMAVIFVRYFETFGVYYETETKVTTVPSDLETVSPWAREAVLKLWGTGLLAGDGVNFNPKGNASRAQAATLCMRTDKAVKTWYSEPGIPSDRVSIDPKSGQNTDTTEPSTGSGTDGKSSSGSEGGSSSGGRSNTTYYKVVFVIDENTKTEKLYAEGTLLSTLPNPAQPSGKVFLGWYYDKDGSKPVKNDDRLKANTTLYARLTDAIMLEENGAPNFVSALDQAPDFTVRVIKDGSAPVAGTDFKFSNITAPDKTPENGSTAEDILNIETVKVEGGDGVWAISSAGGGFTPGHTYQIELINDDAAFDDSTDAVADFKEVYGQENVGKIRIFNFSIEKDGTLNLKLNDDIKYVPANELSKADAVNLMEYAGLYLASTDIQGNTVYTPTDGSGSFTYTGKVKIQAGDTVAVYEGTKPTERLPEKGTKNKTDNGNVSYLKITQVDGYTYHYISAEAEDVLFTPDVLPIDVDENDGTEGWKPDGTRFVIDNNKLDFSDSVYESMGLGSETTVDVGDLLAFYSGDFGDTNAQELAYGEIMDITDNDDGTTTIVYKEITEDEVLSAMDLYDETQLSEEEIQNIIDESKDKIQEIIEAQLMESDFLDETGEYLAGIAIQTDEIKEIFGDDLTLSDCVITYADGTPVGSQDLQLMGNIVDKDQAGKKPKVSVTITPGMAHFDPILAGLGFRAEVAVNYQFKIQKKGNNNLVEVDLTAFFEQEFTVSFKVDGGAVWKKKWIFPYIADYRMTGHLDLGTYTGIGITATAKLTEDEEPWGMPLPKSAREAEATKKIFSLTKAIEDMMDEVFPDEEGSASGNLAEKYADFMDDANDEWVDLISVTLLDLRSAVDPLHVLAFGLQVDFVVSANLNVAAGLTFQYENFKRHSFTLFVLSKNGDSETIDLSNNGYQLDFYIMGHLGLRAGLRVKVTAGLFSTKLAAIGIQFEAGAYIRVWGYFYYHVSKWKENGEKQKDSSYSGALLVELGAYLDVKFIAEALNGKYSYAPSIYTKEWPLLSAGQRENIYDFAYKDEPVYDILNVTTYTLPQDIFDMSWMDLKTGEAEDNVKNFDSNTVSNGDDEKYFAVDLSNANFSYNPANNMITINTASGDITQNCEMKITWKGTALSYSSDVISRTITLNWSNEANAGTIAFDSNGGSAVPMIRLLAGTSLSGRMPENPVRSGYTFAGWYTDKNLSNPFTATAIPKGNTTLYAKWTPNVVGYTVEHYQQALDGQYVLAERDKTQTGLVGTLTSAAAKSYTGFTVQPVSQQTVSPDGSTRVEIYYDRNLYNLTFVYGNGSNDLTLKVPYGSAVVKPSNPTKTGYTFSGWDKDIPDTMPANNLTFTAIWKASTNTPYTVKHYKEAPDGTYALDLTESKTGTAGEYTSAAARTYTGFTAQEFSQKVIGGDGNTAVEIYYNRNTRILNWEVNGGEPLTGKYTVGNVRYGTPIVLPDTPVRTGYNFSGWYMDADLTMPLGENASMPDAELTLYAKWTVNQYTITFDSNGGSEVASITLDYGTPVAEPAAPARSGYTFAGWTLNGVKYSFTTMPAENITLVAEWKALSNIPYTVEYYLQEPDGSFPYDASEIQSLSGTAGTLATAEVKDYTGFTFDSGISGTVMSGTLTENDSLVLKLYYTRNSYTVVFDSNDESGSVTAQYFIYDVEQSLSYNRFSRNGYTFIGWNTEPSGTGTDYANGELVKNLTSAANGIVTLYAQWVRDTGAKYDLWIAGRQVTEKTANDVFEDGTVSYNVYTNTLTLNGALINYDGNDTEDSLGFVYLGAIYATGDLNIELADGTINTVINNTELTSGWSCGIYVSGGKLTIRGTGTLNVTGGTGYTSHGISVNNGQLIIESGKINASGQTAQGVSGIYASRSITINDGTVTALSGKATNGYSRGLESISIIINGGTVTANAEEASGTTIYGSYGFESSTITVNGGTVLVTGNNAAIEGSLTTAEGLNITASKDNDGNMEDYDPDNINTYKCIKIEP